MTNITTQHSQTRFSHYWRLPMGYICLSKYDVVNELSIKPTTTVPGQLINAPLNNDEVGMT